MPTNRKIIIPIVIILALIAYWGSTQMQPETSSIPTPTSTPTATPVPLPPLCECLLGAMEPSGGNMWHNRQSDINYGVIRHGEDTYYQSILNVSADEGEFAASNVYIVEYPTGRSVAIISIDGKTLLAYSTRNCDYIDEPSIKPDEPIVIIAEGAAADITTIAREFAND